MIAKFNYIFDRGEKIRLFFLLIVIVIGTMLELVGVSAILPLVNAIVQPDGIATNKLYIYINSTLFSIGERSFILMLALGLVVIYIIKNVYLTAMYNMQYKYTFNNQRKIATKLMNCYLNQDYLFHVNKNSAELQRNIAVDVPQLFSTVLNCLQLLSEVSVCVILAIFLFMTDITVTLSVTALIVIFLLFFMLKYKKILFRLGNENRDVNFEMSKWILQSLGGIKEIKVLNKESFFLDNYNESYRKFSVVQRKQLLYGVIPRPLMETICIGGLLITMSVKIYMGADMVLFIPVLSVFAVAAFRMLPSFNRIAGYLSCIMYNRPSVDAVYKDLIEIEGIMVKREERKNKSTSTGKTAENVILSNVSFKYPNSEKNVIENIDLEIPFQKSIALVGPSGSGKTTLADIILGILEPQSGTVCYGDQNIFENLEDWHAVVGYIPQSIYLIDDTVKANIAFGVPEDQIDDNKVREAVEKAQLTDLIQSMEDGLNTRIGERGIKLSGGQRQRIGIARALYSNPQILVLDEATSALDTDTEQAVMDAIDSLHGSVTMIVIAHRLSTIVNCDLIYEVSNNAIVEKDKSDIFSS